MTAGGTRKQWMPAGAAAGGRVLLVDSITQLDGGDAGAVVISGSHGGSSSASYALAHPMRLVIFNDAGVGKDAAGIAALGLLQQQGRAAATVSHDSACIGDALDAWQHGLLSHVNPLAERMGLAPGMALSRVLGC